MAAAQLALATGAATAGVTRALVPTAIPDDAHPLALARPLADYRVRRTRRQTHCSSPASRHARLRLATARKHQLWGRLDVDGRGPAWLLAAAVMG